MDDRKGRRQIWIPLLVFLLFGGPEALSQTVAATAARGDATVAFLNVAVMSMQDETLLQDQAVVIRGERILSIGPADEYSVPEGATLIDGSGRFLIPRIG